MRFFAITALAATVAASAPALGARHESCSQAPGMCTADATLSGTSTMLTYQCTTGSQTTTRVTATETVTVIAPPPKNDNPPAESTSTTTLLSTSTEYKTITKTVQRPSGTGMPTGASSTGWPINGNATSSGYAMPSISSVQPSAPLFTGAAAGSVGVSVAALLAVAANFV